MRAREVHALGDARAAGLRLRAADHLGRAADHEEQHVGCRAQRRHGDGQALALELVADEHRDRAVVVDAEPRASLHALRRIAAA